MEKSESPGRGESVYLPAAFATLAPKLLASPKAERKVAYVENTVKVLLTMVSSVKLKAEPNDLNKCFTLAVENFQASRLAEGLKDYTRFIAVFVCIQNNFICLVNETVVA